MEYINDINIQEAIIHILDSNGENPILNEYRLDLDEDIYKFLHKHVEKCLNDEDLKYGIFNEERSIVKEVTQDYLNGMDNDIINLSQEIAKKLFIIMKDNLEIPSCDLLILSLLTDQGPMIGILKLDYIKNFTHQIDFIEDKIGIDIIPQSAGLPGSGQKIQKAAFIKPIREEQKVNLMILDKKKKSEEDEDFFVRTFLGASLIINERDMTRSFLKATETWTRKNLAEDADSAEKLRSAIKNKLKEEEVINVDDLSKQLFENSIEQKEDFRNYVISQSEMEVEVDKAWIEKKLKRVRLKIDKEIDLYINEDIYGDSKKFEIKRNGDGSINMIIKNVINYIEK